MSIETAEAPCLAKGIYPSDTTRQCPYGFYAQLRRQTPVARLGDSNIYLVSRYEDVSEILRDPRRFSSKRPYISRLSKQARDILASGWSVESSLLVGEDPPAHTAHKKLAMRGFSLRRLTSLEANVRDIANELIDGFAGDGRADFISRYAAQLPIRVIASIMAIPREEGEIFRGWAHDTLAMWAGGLTHEREVECATSIIRFQSYIHERVLRRRENLDDTIISDLIQAQGDDGEALSDSEIINMLMVFLRAGFETTVQLLGNLINQLLRNDEQMKKVRGDPSLIPLAVEEALRHQSPVQRTTRMTVTDMTIGGVDVPAGSQLLLLLGSANRDEAVFSHPDKFDIVRSEERHLAFGQGIHACIGSQVARAEAVITLQLLLERFSSISLADPAARLTFLPNPIIRGIEKLDIVFEQACGAEPTA